MKYSSSLCALTLMAHIHKRIISKSLFDFQLFFNDLFLFSLDTILKNAKIHFFDLAYNPMSIHSKRFTFVDVSKPQVLNIMINEL